MDKIYEVLNKMLEMNEVEFRTVAQVAERIIEVKKIIEPKFWWKKDEQRETADKALFECLKFLYDNEHFITSIAPLADCYRYGTGCAINLNIAQKLYFDGMLFAVDWKAAEYCRSCLAELMPKKSQKSPGKWNDVLEMIKAKENRNLDLIRFYIAGLIKDGQLKDYAPGAAFIILQNAGAYGYDDMETMHLGECYYFGIGTEKNNMIAEMLFKSVDPFGPGNDDFYSVEEYDEAAKRLSLYLEGIEDWKKGLSTEEYIEMVDSFNEEDSWLATKRVIYEF